MVADAHTQASGLRVPKPFADTMILDCLRESKGDAIAADEDALRNWARTAMELEGVAVCPETGACLAALAEGIEQGSMERDQEVVVFNTGAAQKYVEVLQVDLPRLQRENIDWDKLS